MRFASKLIACAIAIVACSLGFPQTAPTLHIGDQAPPLTVGRWLKGSPIDRYLSNTEYVVVFWSTWCPEFLGVSEHLNELQAQFNSQIQVVAVSVFETDQNKVIAYVDHLADKMDFDVADDQVPANSKHGLDGTMAKTWLEAADQQGLPIAFIVDHSGKIAWIGSPVGNGIDEAVRKVADNTWDISAYAQKFNSKVEQDKATNDITTQMGDAINRSDWDTALKLSDELIPYDKRAAAAARYLTMLRKGDYSGAYAYCKQISEGPFVHDGAALYALAWVTVNPTGHYEKTDYDLGLDLAKQAVELSYHKNPDMLDLLAWAYFEKKDRENAIATENQALTVARDDQKPKLMESLRTFQAH